MNLPKNLKLLPGVRTDHRGKQYVYGEYPSGKRVIVPYTETGAEPARMIPVKEPSPRKNGKVYTTTDFGDGVRKPVVHIPKRLMIVRYRKSGQNKTVTDTYSNEAGQEFVDRELRTLMRWVKAEVWVPAVGHAYDHFVQSHIDEEVK